MTMHSELDATWNDGIQLPSDGGAPAVNTDIATSSPAPFAYPDGGAISTGGTNANEVCTQAQIAALNPLIGDAPINLPNGAGRLNLAGLFPDGGVSWAGITIEQAVDINCQGVQQTDLFGNVGDLGSVGAIPGARPEWARRAWRPCSSPRLTQNAAQRMGKTLFGGTAIQTADRLCSGAARDVP